MDYVYSKHAFEMNEVKGRRTRCVVFPSYAANAYHTKK